jgi:hypothetical protein
MMGNSDHIDSGRTYTYDSATKGITRRYVSTSKTSGTVTLKLSIREFPQPVCTVETYDA